MYTICLVEDEQDLNNLITTYLTKENYHVISCLDGSSALAITDKIDLWILDIMLKDDISGYDIIKEIRLKDSIVPIIFTSARDQDLDKIMGLELDADDYITKPYSPKELVLRVNKLIKRAYSSDFNKIKYESYEINLDKRIVRDEFNEIDLTTLEFDLLVLLLSNKGCCFSRDDILYKIWGYDYYGSSRVVDDLVRRLRKKMSNLSINTIYGYGYRLV